METFSSLLVLCAGNSPVIGEFPTQRPVTRSFDGFFDLRLNKRLSKHREAADLRRHRAHYDVTVSNCKWAKFLPLINHALSIWSFLDENFFANWSIMIEMIQVLEFIYEAFDIVIEHCMLKIK